MCEAVKEWGREPDERWRGGFYTRTAFGSGSWSGATLALHAERSLQDALVRQTHGDDAGVEVVGPEPYRRDPRRPEDLLESTTFGIRDSGTNDWAFYVQKRQSIYELVGVAFVAGVPPSPQKSSGGWCILF